MAFMTTLAPARDAPIRRRDRAPWSPRAWRQALYLTGGIPALVAGPLLVSAGLVTAFAHRSRWVLPLLFLAGMVLVGVGTFFAQAAATGFVGQAASEHRGIASGSYLACYFCGGLLGTAVLGRLFDAFGWGACVVGVGAALGLAALLTFSLNSEA